MAFFGDGVSYNRVGDNFGGLVEFPGTASYNNIGGYKHTQAPITTTTSVLGVKFKGGVAISADTLASYGSMARFNDCQRVIKVNDNILVGAGGDFADFQYLKTIIDQKVIEEDCVDDGFQMKPKALYHWLTNYLYNRRSKFDPLWLNVVIAGIENGAPFLGTVDKLGTAYEDGLIVTGFGGYMALPLLRDGADKAQGNLTEQQAIQMLRKCQEVLYYRDCRSWPKYTIGVVTQAGVEVSGPFTVTENWEIAKLTHKQE